MKLIWHLFRTKLIQTFSDTHSTSPGLIHIQHINFLNFWYQLLNHPKLHPILQLNPCMEFPGINVNVCMSRWCRKLVKYHGASHGQMPVSEGLKKRNLVIHMWYIPVPNNTLVKGEVYPTHYSQVYLWMTGRIKTTRSLDEYPPWSVVPQKSHADFLHHINHILDIQLKSWIGREKQKKNLTINSIILIHVVVVWKDFWTLF